MVQLADEVGDMFEGDAILHQGLSQFNQARNWSEGIRKKRRNADFVTTMYDELCRQLFQDVFVAYIGNHFAELPSCRNRVRCFLCLLTRAAMR